MRYLRHPNRSFQVLSPLMGLAVAFVWLALGTSLHAQRPARLWQDAALSSRLEEQTSVVFQGRLTLRTPYRSQPNDHYVNQRFHLWLTDGTPAGTDLVLADTVLSNPVVAGNQLLFVGVGGPAGSRLTAYDGTTLTTLADIPICDRVFTLSSYGESLLISGGQAVLHYNLGTQTLQTLSANTDEYLSDGTIVGVHDEPGFFHFRRLDGADDGLIVQSNQDPVLFNGTLYYATRSTLRISDGTIAGTTQIAVPENSPIQNYAGILGGAGDRLLLLTDTNLVEDQPPYTVFLTVANRDGSGVRILRESDPILVDEYTPVFTDAAGLGLFFEGFNNATYYSNGTDAGTTQVLAAPTQGSSRMHQVYHQQNDNLLLFHNSHDGRSTSVVYRSTAGTQETIVLFEENDRHIRHIYGTLGDHLLVAYMQTGNLEQNGFFIGLFDPVTATLNKTDLHPFVIDTDAPLSHFAQAGNVTAVRQGSRQGQNAWLQIYNTATQQHHFLESRPNMMLSAANGKLFIGFGSGSFSNPYTVGTWDETTAQVTPLFRFTGSNLGGSRSKLFQRGNRTGIWTGSFFEVYEAGQSESTRLFGTSGYYLGEAGGAPIIRNTDRIYIVSPDLSSLNTWPLANSDSAKGAVDDIYGYLAWSENNGATKLARINPARGNVQSFTLPDLNRRVGDVLSLSPQRVLVTVFDETTGTGYLLAVNTDIQAVTPLLTLPSSCIADNRFALVRAGNRAFFTAADEATGLELWATDGTVAGTGLVTDLYPGPHDANPTFLKAVGETLTFRANDPVNGSSLWRLAPNSNTPTVLTDAAIAGGVGFRALGGSDEQLFLTTNERDLWWYNPQFPVAFTTPDLVCDDGSTFSVSARAVHPDSQFHWVATNADLIEGQSTDTLVLRADGNGDVQLEVSVTLGETTHTETATIPLSPPPPATPGAVSGANQPCLFAANQIYGIAAVADATAYEWSVPADATIVSGDSTTQIQVTFGSLSGTVQVRAINGCGASEWRSLTVNLTSDTLKADAGPDRPTCDTQIRLAAQRPTGTSGFWRILEGDVTLSDHTDPTATLTFNNPVDATLAWYLQAGACPSTPDTVTYSFVTDTETAEAGPDQYLCTGTIAQLSGNRPAWSNDGSWSIIAGEGGRLTDANLPDATLFGRRGEHYLLQWRLEGLPCGDSVDTVAVVFHGLDGIEAATNQTISLGESVLLEPSTPRGQGYWDILFGPNRDLNQFNRTDNVAVRFTPTHVGQYRLRWHESPSGCDPTSVSTWITVTNEPSLTHRIASFAGPSGAASRRTFTPGLITPDGLILGEGEQGPAYNLVITDGTTMQALFEGDQCTKVFPLPDGGMFVVAVAESHHANFYYRAAGSDSFTFLTGRAWVGSCNKDEPEISVFFGNRLYFTLGGSVYTLDPVDLIPTFLANLNTTTPDLFVWQNSLYAAGDRLLRFNESTMAFETLWTGINSTITTPVTCTSRGLFFSWSLTEFPETGNLHLVYSDGTEIGTTTLITGSVGGIAAAGDLAVFHRDHEAFGMEPWVTDGTEQGTRLLADIDPGPESNAGSRMIAFSHAGYAFFYRDAVLWRSDGSLVQPFLSRPRFHWYTTVGDDLLLWDGLTLVQTPAASPEAQPTVRYQHESLDLAQVDLLAVWQNRVYLQRSDEQTVQVLAVPLNGDPIVTIDQSHRPAEFQATYLGAWDNHMLLIDAGTPFTLNRYSEGGAVTPLLHFDSDPNPVTPFPIGQTVFFTAGARQTLYRTDGSHAAVVGSPALHQVAGVQVMDQGLLFFAENGDGRRRAYFCDLAGEPQVLGTGVEPSQPRSSLSATQFHRLGESPHALFFLESETGVISLWRWSANLANPVKIQEFTPGQERAVAAVAEAQNDYALFQISSRLYGYLVADGQVRDLANGDLRYQGTFGGVSVFLIGDTQLGWSDADGSWHQTDLLLPIDRVYGKSQGYWLVHRPEDPDYKIARLRLNAAVTPENIWGYTTIHSILGNIPGALVHVNDHGVGLADPILQETWDLPSFSNSSTSRMPYAVTDHAVYFSGVEDTLVKTQALPLLDFRDQRTLGAIEVFDVYPGPGNGTIRWLRRLGDGVVVCTQIPGQGQALWHINDFSATRLERGLSARPNYRVMAEDPTRLVIADIGNPSAIVLHHVSAETTMFPDPTLAEALLAAHDVDGNRYLDQQERAAVTEIDLSGLAIQRINGLQFFPNLRYIDLSDNLITDWSPLLENDNFGRQPGSYLNLSLNPESWILCAQYDALSTRMNEMDGELVSLPTKTYRTPRFNTWPRNNVLQLLRPDFVASHDFYLFYCQFPDLKRATGLNEVGRESKAK